MKISALLPLCSVLLFLGGCATPTNLKPVDLGAPPAEDVARVILFRKSKFAGSGTFPDVHVDGTKKGALYIGSYMVLELPPGTHTIVAQGSFLTFPFPHAEAQLPVEGGKDYYLMFETDLVDMTLVSSSWTNGFYLVAPDYGKSEVQKLKRRL